MKLIIYSGSAVFLFLLNSVWAYPLSILSQEFTIHSWDLLNPIMIIIYIITIVWFIIACILNHIKTAMTSKLLSIYLNATCIILIAVFLYRFILPYKLSYFQDSTTLVPAADPLAFSKIYYLLDIMVLASSIILTIVLSKVLSKKKSLYIVMLLFTVFYGVDNLITILTVKPTLSKSTEKTLTISKNHNNLVVIILDAMTPEFMYNSITNSSTKNLQIWSKDFTFYDNVASLGLSGTMVSVASMLGGYEATPHKQMEIINKEKITYDQLLKDRENYTLPEIYDAHYFMAGRGMQNIKNTLSNVATVDATSYYHKLIDIKIDLLRSPILGVSLYRISPYFIRHLYFTKNKAWLPRFFTSYKWVQNNTSKLTVIKDTDYGTFNFIHNHGTHYSHMYTNDAGEIEYGDKTGNVYKNIMEATLVSSIFIKELITELKKQNIYNNTKIIITSDHGLQVYNEYLYLFPQKKELYSNTMFSGRAPLVSVFFMIKDFSTTQSQLKLDSRFLSLADTPNIIVSSFIDSTNYPDYTKIQPPKRVFNIVPWYYTQFTKAVGKKKIGGWDANSNADEISNSYITNNTNVLYLKISNIVDPSYAIKEYPIDTIDQLPSFEIIK